MTTTTEQAEQQAGEQGFRGGQADEADGITRAIDAVAEGAVA